MAPLRIKHAVHCLFALAVSLVVGCVVGPDFDRPRPPEVDRYTAEMVTTSNGNVSDGEAQRFVQGMDISGDWWTLFQSKPLNDLIERALMENPDIKAAQAALTIARENVLAQKGSYYPSVDAILSASNQKTSADLSPTPSSGDLYFNLYTPQVNVSYVPDVFGLNRRTLESLEAQAEQQHFLLAATLVTLSSNIVVAAIQEASLREQIDVTQELISVNTDMLKILRTQFARGYASRLAVAAQESQLAQVTAGLPPLRRQLAQQRDLLAALSGGFPGSQPEETFHVSSLHLPRELPVSLPSHLVEQRPDIRQAEENMRSASALIGVAVANRLPTFTLTADVGSMALTASRMFAGGTGFWDLAAGVTQPIFRGGTLLHRELAARAAYAQASEQYRRAVLTAFQNVADTLNALEQDGDALTAADAATNASKVTLELAQKQWKSGYADYLALLSAEQGYQQSLMTLVQARANRYMDTAALFQALGGGWWHRVELSEN